MQQLQQQPGFASFEQSLAEVGTVNNCLDDRLQAAQLPCSRRQRWQDSITSRSLCAYNEQLLIT
jgi:hypothetical protein